MKKGIDISQHNGSINFNSVKNAGIEFVIIRLGWIGNKNNHTLDIKFEENYKKAKAQGLKIGCYIYSYVENETAMTSAISWVKEKLKGKTLDYPLFLDVEDSQISSLSVETLTNLCKQFCNSFSEYVTGIYANKNWFTTKLNVNELTNYKIWLAEWNGKNMHTANFKVDMWQYTSDGSVSGINGRVDMNYCLNCDENSEITGQKTNEEIANEVIQNLWGNGDDRKNRLQQAGYNYKEIQKIVNDILNSGEEEEMKTYQNGSTVEPVYSDTNCTNKIGSLNAWEKCDCLGTFNNRAIVRYKVDNSNNYKIGFVKWLGGVK